MSKVGLFLKGLWTSVCVFFAKHWKRFRLLKRRYQIGIVVLLLILVGGGIALTRSGAAPASTDLSIRTVSVASVDSLSGGGDSVSILGTVRSVTEADILSEAGGTVRAVHTSVGASVPAGFVLAELDNASEQATVLQAQGAYDAAVAARSITTLQSGNAQTSFVEAATAARNTYSNSYTTIDNVLSTEVSTLFGDPTPLGPQLLLNSPDRDTFSRRRATLADQMNIWRSHLATVDTQDPETLLNEADTNAQTVSVFLADLSAIANMNESGGTPSQLAALAAARTSVDGVRASLSAARDAYRAKQTAAEVGTTQSVSSNASTASADANVKQALGALRFAQASLEKTLVRAPISGTVNFLPIHVGDYVTAFTHVATVAQNGALEIVAYVSEDDRAFITTGAGVMVNDNDKGIVTSIAPALDPTTKQIEVHVAVDASTDLVNGQSVRIAFPNLLSRPATPTISQTLTLPLAAVKLRTNSRVVFSVGADGRLVSHTVEIGNVLGDRIEITTPLPSDLQIVTDARGLADGEKVNVATSTTATP